MHVFYLLYYFSLTLPAPPFLDVAAEELKPGDDSKLRTSCSCSCYARAVGEEL